MKDRNTNRLPKLTKVLLDIIFGMLVIGIALLVIWMILSPILGSQFDILGSASIPVAIGTGDDPRIDVTFNGLPKQNVANVYIEEARGILRLETHDSILILLANGSKLLTAIGLAYIFYLLRKIMGSILEGDPFQENSIKNIQQLGYAVLIVGFGSGIFEGIAAWEILRILPDVSPGIQATATFDARLILGASLFIFLLAQIWVHGLELERDRALTV